MDVTEQQLFDYLQCPVYYDITVNKKLPSEQPVQLSDLLMKVTRFFYLQLSLGEVPTLATLKRKWDMVFQPYQEILGEKKAIEGLQLLMKLYDWAKETKLVVIDIDSPYAITSGKNKLEGVMGVIVAGKNGRDELLVTSFSPRMSHEDLDALKLKYTIDSYAYRLKYGKDLSGIRIHHVKHGKDSLTFRKNSDYERLFGTINGVCKSLENNIYYVRDHYGCAICPVNNLCKYWFNNY